jgi:hypothetical protein
MVAWAAARDLGTERVSSATAETAVISLRELESNWEPILAWWHTHISGESTRKLSGAGNGGGK